MSGADYRASPALLEQLRARAQTTIDFHADQPDHTPHVVVRAADLLALVREVAEQRDLALEIRREAPTGRFQPLPDWEREGARG